VHHPFLYRHVTKYMLLSSTMSSVDLLQSEKAWNDVDENEKFKFRLLHVPSNIEVRMIV
jgi:hypothetical protein